MTNRPEPNLSTIVPCVAMPTVSVGAPRHAHNASGTVNNCYPLLTTSPSSINDGNDCLIPHRQFEVRRSRQARAECPCDACVCLKLP